MVVFECCKCTLLSAVSVVDVRVVNVCNYVLAVDLYEYTGELMYVRVRRHLLVTVTGSVWLMIVCPSSLVTEQVKFEV